MELINSWECRTPTSNNLWVFGHHDTHTGCANAQHFASRTRRNVVCGPCL